MQPQQNNRTQLLRAMFTANASNIKNTWMRIRPIIATVPQSFFSDAYTSAVDIQLLAVLGAVQERSIKSQLDRRDVTSQLLEYFDVNANDRETLIARASRVAVYVHRVPYLVESLVQIVRMVIDQNACIPDWFIHIEGMLCEHTQRRCIRKTRYDPTRRSDVNAGTINWAASCYVTALERLVLEYAQEHASVHEIVSPLMVQLLTRAAASKQCHHERLLCLLPMVVYRLPELTRVLPSSLDMEHFYHAVRQTCECELNYIPHSVLAYALSQCNCSRTEFMDHMLAIQQPRRQQTDGVYHDFAVGLDGGWLRAIDETFNDELGFFDLITALSDARLSFEQSNTAIRNAISHALKICVWRDTSSSYAVLASMFAGDAFRRTREIIFTHACCRGEYSFSNTGLRPTDRMALYEKAIDTTSFDIQLPFVHAAGLLRLRIDTDLAAAVDALDANKILQLITFASHAGCNMIRIYKTAISSTSYKYSQTWTYWSTNKCDTPQYDALNALMLAIVSHPAFVVQVIDFDSRRAALSSFERHYMYEQFLRA